ncbi:sugar ABC transporter substrate-binding protein [Pseudomonas sp. MAFF 302030]|jgi:ABC-type sugar transport system substrate-binding protein|uniref:Sugar ABC transporter substrate-binding protein n=1 Tax=Pseudomonas morbosilactucae TaxID=2938197 RepID=A0A9X1YWT8_9PSED|nr:sugar ABC transporter substrate-binding protein [Pseudomonas morbosilactucae]MCK9799139.1 sugar ABC transporter substrate-binding protein [Pseudomonas morbosilactucae]
MRRFLGCLCALLLSVSAHAELRIGVTVGQYDNYISYLVKAMQDRAKQVPGGVTLQVEDSASDVVRQLSQVESFISQKVDAIIVNPADTAATRKISEKVIAAGIPLVYMNSRPEVDNLPPGVVFVGTDERAIGRMQMQYLAEKMGGKGNLAVILGRLAHSDTGKRTSGVKDVLAQYPGIKIVEEQSGDWQREKGMDLMNEWLTKGQTINAVASNNDEMGIGAAMALRQAGRDDILVGGIDGTPDGLLALKKGQLSVSVFRDPVAIGAGSLDAAVKLVNHEALQGDLWVPTQLVTPENYAQFQH